MTRKTKSSQAAKQSSNVAGNEAGTAFQPINVDQGYPIRTRNDMTSHTPIYQTMDGTADRVPWQTRNDMVSQAPEYQTRNDMTYQAPRPSTVWPYRTPEEQTLFQPVNTRHLPPPINAPIESYQTQFQVNIAPRPPGPPLPGAERAAQEAVRLQEYQMQLMLLEMQNKKRLIMPGQTADTAPGGNPSGPSSEATRKAPGQAGLQDWQMQLMLLEKQNKKRLMMQRKQETTENAAQNHNTGAMSPRQLAAHIQEQPDTQTQLAMIEREMQALQEKNLRSWGERRQDYQIQLLMLELQNQKRKILNPDAIEASSRHIPQTILPSLAGSPNFPGNVANPNTYQMQLMQLEQQNKSRLVAARAEQEAAQAQAEAEKEKEAYRRAEGEGGSNWVDDLSQQRQLLLQQKAVRER